MTSDPRNRIFVAFDTQDTGHALQMARQLHGVIGGIKIGLEFFVANGMHETRRVAETAGLPLFLDLKLHDIPNTVAGAVRAAVSLHPKFLTLHASGGAAMMRAAAEVVRSAGADTKLLAVTVLTSLDGDDLMQVGQDPSPGHQVRRLAKLAVASGCAGIVCAPTEVQGLRAQLGAAPVLVTPGVRPAGAAMGDQKRTMTPHDAITAGADYLVIGRPITAASEPRKAAESIVAGLGS